MNQKDVNRITEWKIINSWWVLLSPVYLAWAGFLYIGIKTKTFKWILFGCLYILFFGYCLTPTGRNVLNANRGSVLMVIYLIVSIVHSLFANQEYLIRQEVIDRENLRELDKNRFRTSIYVKYSRKHTKGIDINALFNQENSKKNNKKNTSYASINAYETAINSNISSVYQNNAVSNQHIITENANYSANLLDINTASVDDIAKLSGINSIQAKKLIQYRESHGHFSSVDEFLNLVNMPNSMKERLRSNLTCGNGSKAPMNATVSGNHKAYEDSLAPESVKKHNGHGRAVDY